MTAIPHFTSQLFKFLNDLRRHNHRDWFVGNKERYERAVRDPFLRFIADFALLLYSISPNFVADPRPTGGSLFRIYRDTRFSKDKSPYKTHAAAYFPHRRCSKGGHAPGFYLHLEPGGCFAGAGIWHPDSVTLTKVRIAIAERSKDWEKARRQLRAHRLQIEGDQLTRVPKGYDPEHRFVDDIKRKDFVTIVDFSQRQVCSPRFLVDYLAACRRMSPLVEFLTGALDLPW